MYVSSQLCLVLKPFTMTAHYILLTSKSISHRCVSLSFRVFIYMHMILCALKTIYNQFTCHLRSLSPPSVKVSQPIGSFINISQAAPLAQFKSSSTTNKDGTTSTSTVSSNNSYQDMTQFPFTGKGNVHSM